MPYRDHGSERAGVNSTRSLTAGSYANYEVKFEHETLVALAVLSRGNDPAFGNAVFLVGWSEDWLWLLGGNQTNQVSVAAYVRNHLVVLRWSADIGEIVSGGATHRGGTAFQTALRHVLVFEGVAVMAPTIPAGQSTKGSHCEPLLPGERSSWTLQTKTK